MPGLLALLQAAVLQQPYIPAGPQCTRPGGDVRLVQYSIKDGDRCEEPDDGFSRPSYYGTEGYNYCWHVRILDKELQLYKLRELDSLVREAVEQCGDGAGAERASTRAVSRGAASRVSGSGSSRSSRCIVEMSQ